MRKKFNFFLYAILTLSFFFFGFGCKEKPTEIIKEDPNDPAKYQWSVDTLFYTSGTSSGQTLVNDMYGLNDSAVYAVGHDAWGGSGSTWFYDGRKWNRKKVFIYEGGFLQQAIDFKAVYGIDTANIFFGGSHVYTNPVPPPNFIDSAVVWQYIYSSWKKINFRLSNPINKIFGTSISDMYFCGRNLLFHYDGQSITADTIPSIFNNLNKSQLTIDYMFKTKTNDIFVSSSFFDITGITYYQFVQNHNNNWVLLDTFVIRTSSNSAKWGNASLWISKTDVVFACGYGGIYKFVGSSWQNIFPLEFISAIYGTDENHMFALSLANDLYFFNGIVWKKIFNPSNKNYSFGHLWCTQKQVFLSFQDGIKSYVFRGTIKS